MTNAVIIGFGSIGKLHKLILENLGLKVLLVTKHGTTSDGLYRNIKDVVKNHKIDYIVISNITSQHHITLQEIEEIGYCGKVLIEKPLYDLIPKNIPEYSFQLAIGYNLRFHPVIEEVSKLLIDQKILSAHHYVGQHLSTWRDIQNYKENYSANKSMGGGVLRDLSHEIDLMMFLYGDIKKYSSFGGKYSDITVDSEEVAIFIMQHKSCPAVSLQMNYYDHVKRRDGIINTEKFSIKYDLVNSKYFINDKEYNVVSSRESSYKKMHESFLFDKNNNLCSFVKGLEIIKMINDSEKNYD